MPPPVVLNIPEKEALLGPAVGLLVGEENLGRFVRLSESDSGVSSSSSAKTVLLTAGFSWLSLICRVSRSLTVC